MSGFADHNPYAAHQRAARANQARFDPEKSAIRFSRSTFSEMSDDGDRLYLLSSDLIRERVEMLRRGELDV